MKPKIYNAISTMFVLEQQFHHTLGKVSSNVPPGTSSCCRSLPVDGQTWNKVLRRRPLTLWKTVYSSTHWHLWNFFLMYKIFSLWKASQINSELKPGFATLSVEFRIYYLYPLQGGKTPSPKKRCPWYDTKLHQLMRL